MRLDQLDQGYEGFARSCLRVPSKEAGAGYVPFAFNGMQRQNDLRHLRSHKRRSLRLKARQLGMTTYYLGRHLYRCLLIPAYRVGIVALKGEEGATQIARALRTMYAMLPSELKEQLPALVKETDEVLEWKNGSRIHLFTQGGGEVGRGLSFHCLHLTEFGKYSDPATTFAAILPALAPDGELVIESTPGGFNTYYELWQEAKADPDSAWDAAFYPWWVHEAYVAPVPAAFEPKPDEAALMEAHGLTPEQIAFRRLKQREQRALFPQEYAENDEDCWLSTGDSVFSYEAISRLRQGCRPAVETLHEGLLQIWQPPFPGKPYVIGADCAEGVPGGDSSAAVVLRAGGGSHVATLMDAPPFAASRDGRMNPNEFARLVAQLGRRYGDALVLVELNGPGFGVLAALRDTHHYPNIGTTDGRDGFRTNAASKSALVTQFRDSLDTEEFTTYDLRLPRQMSDFVVLERSSTYEKVGARKGAHDDLVMATMLANHARPAAQLMQNRAPLFTPFVMR